MMRQLTDFRLTYWHVILIIMCCCLLFCIPANCQSTTTGLTAIDQASTVWANGTWKLDIVPNPNSSQNLSWNGAPLPNTEWHYAGALDGSGAFTASVPSNNFITPVGSTYTITICPNATAPCVVIIRQTVQGSSIDFSSTFTANAPAPQVKPLPLARAYNDAEVSASPLNPGYFYQNVSSNQPRYWDGVQWSNFGSGLTSVHLNNFDPIFTVTVNSGDPLNPIYTFHAETELAGRVYANCTASTGNPSFCAITAAMLPSSITSNTSGSAGSLASVTACAVTAPQTFATGMTVAGVFACHQVKFSDLSGNIAVSQMDSGTNADASHFWAGSGHWLATSTITAGIPIIRTASAAGCTTPSGGPTGNDCVQTLTWSGGGFADTSYTPVCSASSPFNSGSTSEANAVNMIGWGSLTNTTINVETVSKGSDGSASFGTVACIGVHL